MTDGAHLAGAGDTVAVEIRGVAGFARAGVDGGVAVVAIAHGRRAGAVAVDVVIVVGVRADACAALGEAGHGVDLALVGVVGAGGEVDAVVSRDDGGVTQRDAAGEGVDLHEGIFLHGELIGVAAGGSVAGGVRHAQLGPCRRVAAPSTLKSRR